MNGKRQKKLTRRIAANLAGVAAGVSMLLGGLVNSTDELLPDEERSAKGAPIGTMVLRESAPSAKLTRIPLPQKVTFADRARLWLWNLPVLVRAAVLLPLWAAGRGFIALMGLLRPVLSPLAMAALYFLLQTLLLFGLFLLLYRLLFPNGSIRDLFRKGRWLWLVGAALLMTAADRILLWRFAKWDWIRALIAAGVAFFVLAFCWNRLFFDHAEPKPSETWIEIPDVA